MTISVSELETYAGDFNAKDYTRKELLTILGIAICLRTDIHRELDARRNK